MIGLYQKVRQRFSARVLVECAAQDAYPLTFQNEWPQENLLISKSACSLNPVMCNAAAIASAQVNLYAVAAQRQLTRDREPFEKLDSRFP